MSDAVTIGRRFFEELLGKGDASVADEILADDIVMALDIRAASSSETGNDDGSGTE